VSSGADSGLRRRNTTEANWLDGVKESFVGVEKQEEVIVSLQDVKAGIRKMANWKVPGPNRVRDYWFKRFPSLHTSIATALHDC